MLFKSKKIPLLILGATALVCSRLLFVFFNDPEGPNLLVVLVTAVIVYVPSLAVYVYAPSTADQKKLLLAIFIQILLVAALYFFLR